jgi:predicted acylesterase/phospholipase RssA
VLLKGLVEEPPRSTEPVPGRLALVLTGGGARAAYQVGVLGALAQLFPRTRFDIITGVSAGAINALFLASRRTPLAATVNELCGLWQDLRIEDVFRVDATSLLRHVASWSVRLVSGGSPLSPRVGGLVDTAPLRRLLTRMLPDHGDGAIAGIEENLAECQPTAVALTTLDSSRRRKDPGDLDEACEIPGRGEATPDRGLPAAGTDPRATHERRVPRRHRRRRASPAAVEPVSPGAAQGTAPGVPVSRPRGRAAVR